MLTGKAILPVLVSLCLLCQSVGQTLAEEDFSKTSDNWNAGRMGGCGKHIVQNGRLEFSTDGKSTSNDSASLPWKNDILRFDESWRVQVEVSLGNFQLGESKPYAGLAILVHGPEKTKNSFIRLQLRRGPNGFRAFNADGFIKNRILMGSKMMPTLSEAATLRIQFDANAKTLTASYDDDSQGPNLFAPLYNVDIGKGLNSWRMSGSDVFNFEIVSQSTNTVVNHGDMTFDDVFALRVQP